LEASKAVAATEEHSLLSEREQPNKQIRSHLQKEIRQNNKRSFSNKSKKSDVSTQGARDLSKHWSEVNELILSSEHLVSHSVTV